MGNVIPFTPSVCIDIPSNNIYDVRVSIPNNEPIIFNLISHTADDITRILEDHSVDKDTIEKVLGLFGKATLSWNKSHLAV